MVMEAVDLFEVADHVVVIMEGAMAMLGGVVDIAIQAVPPGKHRRFGGSFRSNLKPIRVHIKPERPKKGICVYYLCCLHT